MRPETLRGLLTQIELSNLLSLRLIKPYSSGAAYALTSGGVNFLSGFFPDAIPKYTQSYHKEAVQRQLRVSEIVYTAYRAGVDVFTLSTEGLLNSPALFLSSVTRGRGANPWGSARVAALAHLGDMVCAIHYVCPDIGKIAVMDELSAFTNQTAQFIRERRALIFAGETYADILSELEAPRPRRDSKLMFYGEAYDSLTLPIHLLPCDDIGAKQLQIMAVADYRRKLTHAALKNQFQPPPVDVPEIDALFQGQPFIMAADMALRRIDKAVQTTKGQIAIAALKPQAEEVLFPRYRDTGKARVFILTDEAIAQALGRPLNLYIPSRRQFTTEKGDVINAPLIQADRKA